MKLSLQERKAYLEHNAEHKNIWKDLTKTKQNLEEKIFEVLSKYEYKNFNKAKVYNADTDTFEDSTRYYEDNKFRWAIQQIKILRNTKWVNANTIQKMKQTILALQAAEAALNSSVPTSPPTQISTTKEIITNKRTDNQEEPETDDYSNRLRMH